MKRRPRQHEFGFKKWSRSIDESVEGWRHSVNSRMPDPALDVGDVPDGVALVPRAIELFGGGPELNDEVAGQVLRLNLAPFLLPEADKGRFVIAHDDPGVGAADEGAATLGGFSP